MRSWKRKKRETIIPLRLLVVTDLDCLLRLWVPLSNQGEVVLQGSSPFGAISLALKITSEFCHRPAGKKLFEVTDT